MQLSQLGMDKKEVAALNKKHIYTTDDLVRAFPRLYRDYRRVVDPSACMDGDYCAVYGHMTGSEVRSGPKMKYLRLRFETPSGTRFRADYFVGRYAAYLGKTYAKYNDTDVVLTGKVSVDPTYGISVANAEIYPASEFVPGIYPVYPKSKNLDEKSVLLWMERCLDAQGEILEKEIRGRYGLLPYRDALLKLHRPQTPGDIELGQKQMAFYDLYRFEMKRKELESGRPDQTTVTFPDTSMMERFISSLPFPLTTLPPERAASSDGTWGGQEQIIRYLTGLAAEKKRMEAVIEGDVGCGKTAVAGALAVLAASNGWQAAIMAPKTVLASQHAAEILAWCSELGLVCASLIGTPKNAAERKQRKAVLESIRNGTADVVVGTHACFGKDVEYNNLGLIIIDEEQQFGVEQKARLRAKALPDAHYLEMSATPVPRSLALSIYGSREVLRITEKPAGRQRIQTASCTKEETAMRFMEKQLTMGRQCYVVVPMIEENEDSGIDGVRKTAKKYAERFNKYTVVSVDGKMKEEEFLKGISAFKEGRADILVATTVVEVGVNVPNATVIVIENAERFGLSQLHQLRGRVGRKDLPSYCILITDNRENKRIQVMEETEDGFAIAEQDLLLRGPGDVNGLRQSGQNRYITQALLYPDIHRQAKEAAAMSSSENRYGVFLTAVYDEHESFEEEV